MEFTKMWKIEEAMNLGQEWGENQDIILGILPNGDAMQEVLPGIAISAVDKNSESINI